MAPIFTGSKFGFGRGDVAAATVFSATGGDIANGLAPGNGYKYHTFGSPGNFVVSSSGTIEVLIVGGGGGGRQGGGAAGGGGGAGGLRYFSSIPLTAGTYPIVVGSGSPFKNYGPQAPSPPSGRDSSAFTYTANAGGDAGAYPPNNDGQPGGSGGGGGGYVGGGAGSGTPGQGNPGGGGNTVGGDSGYSGGGGGGAGAAGQPADPGNGSRSQGGNGLQYPQFNAPLICQPTAPNGPAALSALGPLNGYFAGGGGGGIRIWPSPFVQGGLGGGGNGGTRTPATTSGQPGVTYSGGGGGGESASPAAGNGAPGIVIIRYLA